MEKTLFVNNGWIFRPVCMVHASSLCWKDHSYEESLQIFVHTLVNDLDYKTIFKERPEQLISEYVYKNFKENKFDGQTIGLGE